MIITKKESKNNYNAIIFCVRAKTKEPFMNMHLLCARKDRMFATDGHRLHYAPVSEIPDGIYEYSKTKSTITLKPVDTAEYLDCERVIPETFAHEVETSNAEFASLCRSAIIILNSGQYWGVKLTFAECLKVEATNPDIGNMWGEVALSKSIDPEVVVGINHKYLLDALKGFGKQVTISLQKDSSMALSLRDDIGTSLIMPMRI